MLAAAVLAVRRWAADRAEAAEQRARELRAQHAVSAAEADIAQVRPGALWCSFVAFAAAMRRHCCRKAV